MTIVDLNYFIATGYLFAVFTLAFVLVRSVAAGDTLKKMPTLFFTTWLGFGLFLGGCGAHHLQHAHHLQMTGMHASVGEYTAAIIQVIGEIVCVFTTAIFIRRLPNRLTEWRY